MDKTSYDDLMKWRLGETITVKKGALRYRLNIDDQHI
jgi:hypothetical protein